jgi:hypothetical protein
MTIFSPNVEYQPAALRVARSDSTTKFEYSFVCAKKDAISKLIELKNIIESHNFLTSNIFRLFNKDCGIRVLSDPLQELKLQSQMLVLHNKMLMPVNPIQLFGFATKLPDSSVAHFALAKYPKFIQLDGKMVELHDSDAMHWKGFVTFNDSDYEDEGYTALEFMYRIMRYARILKILNEYTVSS